MGAQLMACVAEGDRGRIYLDPAHEDEVIAQTTEPSWGPDAELPTNARWFSPPAFGMTHYRDLFTARQLVSLTAFGDLIEETRERICKDAVLVGLPDDGLRLVAGGAGASAYADAVATYLALALSRTGDWNSRLGRWEPNGQVPQQIFGRQAIAMTWDFSECGILGSATGSFTASVENVVRSIAALSASASRGVPGMVVQADAQVALADDARRYAVSTDPPYYDNIGYADLSDFFYVWLRRSLGRCLPGPLRDAARRRRQPSSSRRRIGSAADKAKAEAAFRERSRRRLRSACARWPTRPFPSRSTTPSSRPSRTAMAMDGGRRLDRLGDDARRPACAAGFAIVGTWPMRTRAGNRMIASGTNALASSIVLVCRPRADRRRHHDPQGLRRRASSASCPRRCGPSSTATSRRSTSPRRRSGPGWRSSAGTPRCWSRTARRCASGPRSHSSTRRSTSSSPSRRASSTPTPAGRSPGTSSSASARPSSGPRRSCSKAKNSSVAGLVEAGIVAASRGESGSSPRDEYSGDWDPAKDKRIPVWEATQRLVHALLTDGEAAAAELLARLGGLGDTARDLAYRLYHVAERKGWTDEARAYNALVVAWPTSPVARSRHEPPSRRRRASGSSRGRTMALTNKERIGRMLDVLAAGLKPVVEQEFTKAYGPTWVSTVAAEKEMSTGSPARRIPNDPQFLLNAIQFHWRTTLGKTLGMAERNYVAELRETRNRWAHAAGKPFTDDDVYRAFDTAERLLRAVAAPQADDLLKAKIAVAQREHRRAAKESRRRSRRPHGGRRRAAQGTRALADARHAASRRRVRQLPAGGVRGGPRPGRARARAPRSTSIRASSSRGRTSPRASGSCSPGRSGG